MKRLLAAVCVVLASCSALSPTTVDIADEPAGANCPAGGKAVKVGKDSNGDGLLAPAEVTKTQYVCNGVDGKDGAAGAAGATGPAGEKGTTGGTGQTGATGQPGANGQPGAAGQAGASALVKETLNATPTPDCPKGTRKIELGVDDNRNGTLDAAEVDSVIVVCATAANFMDAGWGANCAAQGKCTKTNGTCGDSCTVGCCLPNDAQGRCQTAVNNAACGKFGATCSACAGNTTCGVVQGGTACSGGADGGTDGGQVLADGVVGTACTQDSQCGSDPADFCWGETMQLDGGTEYTGFKGGYCQASCADMYDFSSGSAAVKPGYGNYCGNTGYCLLFSQTEGYCYELCVNNTQTAVGTTSGQGSCRNSNYVCWGFGSLYNNVTDPNALKLGVCAGDCRTIENDPVAKAARGGSACAAGYTCNVSGPNTGFCCKAAADGGTDCEAYL